MPGKFATDNGTVVVERTIPEIESADQCICLRSSQQEVRAYIDGELTFTKRSITVTAKDHNKTYDGTALTAICISFYSFVAGVQWEDAPA